MNDNIVAINSESLKKLILDIYDYRDKLSKILQDAELVVKSTEIFYKTLDGDEFRKKFEKLSVNFPKILSNLKSYGDDLSIVLSKYKEVNSKSVDIFKKTL